MVNAYLRHSKTWKAAGRLQAGPPVCPQACTHVGALQTSGSTGMSLLRLCGAREEQDVFGGDVHGVPAWQRLLKEVSQLWYELEQVMLQRDLWFYLL